VAAMSRESMRPVLPFLREAAVDRAEPVGGRAGAPGLPPHHPASARAHHRLLGKDPAGLAEPFHRVFPHPGSGCWSPAPARAASITLPPTMSS
jgi:hypothetical protein